MPENNFKTILDDVFKTNEEIKDGDFNNNQLKYQSEKTQYIFEVKLMFLK